MTLYQLKFIDYVESSSSRTDWKRRSWFISTPEPEKKQIIDFVLERDKDEETLDLSKQPLTEDLFNNRDKLDFLLKALTLPMTLDQIMKQTNNIIPHNEIPKLLTTLQTNGLIFQPDDYHYQKI